MSDDISAIANGVRSIQAMCDEPLRVFSLARPAPFLGAGLFSHFHVSSRLLNQSLVPIDLLSLHKTAPTRLDSFGLVWSHLMLITY